MGEDIKQCKQLLVKFRDSSIPIVSELTAALEEVRFDEITIQAHKLKSSAKTVGAEGLADLCINMEQAGKDRTEDKLRTLGPKLTDEFDRVKHYIDQLA